MRVLCWTMGTAHILHTTSTLRPNQPISVVYDHFRPVDFLFYWRDPFKSCEQAAPTAPAVFGNGRYKTTSRNLDHIRDFATFDVNALSSYKLGTGDGCGVVEGAEILDIPTAEQLHKTSLKIQSLILVMDDRIRMLEQKGAPQNNGGMSNSGDGRKKRSSGRSGGGSGGGGGGSVGDGERSSKRACSDRTQSGKAGR
jgi:uncharacterized membrane protein YgcG